MYSNLAIFGGKEESIHALYFLNVLCQTNLKSVQDTDDTMMQMYALKSLYSACFTNTFSTKKYILFLFRTTTKITILSLKDSSVSSFA